MLLCSGSATIGFGSYSDGADTRNRRYLQERTGTGQNKNAAFTLQIQLSSTKPSKNVDSVVQTSALVDHGDGTNARSTSKKTARPFLALSMTLLLALPFHWYG